MIEVFAFECNVQGQEWASVINARTAGEAKAHYWRRVHDAWQDVAFTDVRVRKLGAAQTSEDFQRVADSRGVAFRCGDRVKCGNAYGTIVGHNASANFDVLFDDDAPVPMRNQRLNVHPHNLFPALQRPEPGEERP